MVARANDMNIKELILKIMNLSVGRKLHLSEIEVKNHVRVLQIHKERLGNLNLTNMAK